jgi:DNA segregation ATPase FtsK/SpoIIIE, S-DNA-T family
MSLSSRTTKTSTSPLSPKIAGLLREAAWLALAAVACYLLLVLVTYHADDPAWSHTSDGVTRNAGGVMGAWASDILLYLFGLSAYWTVIGAGYGVWAGFRRLRQQEVRAGYPGWVTKTGFVMLLLGSSSLEALRMHRLHVQLPLAPGGVLGGLLGDALNRGLGFTGATLFLLLVIAVGFSLFTGASWITIVEKVGAAMEFAVTWTVETWQTWVEKRAGRRARIERKVHVTSEKKRIDEQPPVHIEPPVIEIPQSTRVQQEKQVPLFAGMPDSPLPPVHLLDEADRSVELISPETLEFTSRLIERKLNDFGVSVQVLAAYPGPVITRYEIEPATGVKGSQITNLARDLARALSVMSIRVVETIPGKSCMGLEIPNPKRQMVRLSEIIGAQVYADMRSPLTIAMGKDIAGNPVVADLAKMPHALVAGTTGSGKSVAINAMILSLLYKADPKEVRLILVDPKMLELSIYEGIPHLLAPVVTDMKQASYALNWCVAEMERRYKLMSLLGVRNLAGCNQKIRDAAKAGTPLTNPQSLTPEAPEPLEEMPHIVVVIDELADLMMVVGKKVEELIARLAQKARAAGIHLVLATQRPSVDVITGLIKANIPTRVAFQVSSKIDSRTILDQMGAEALLGQGDMLYLPPGSGLPQRVHGAFVADQEVHKVVEHLKTLGQPNYIDGILQGGDGDSAGGDLGTAGGGSAGEADPLYDEAVAIVLKTRRASISAVQRHLRIGYNRAARLIEDMEKAGLVSPMETNGNRSVLVPAQAE